MYSKHAEGSVGIQAPIERVFQALDNHARLSSHMSRSSWRMGGGRMQMATDSGNFQTVGSHLVLSGKAFGLPLHVEEVVTRREPPLTKVWETIDSPHLFVIGPYRLGFELRAADSSTLLRVFIDYDLPARGFSRLLGLLFGSFYARWCVRQMLKDAARRDVTEAAFAKPHA